MHFRLFHNTFIADLSGKWKLSREAYTRAMEDIDWPRIAYFLKKSDRAADEKNKKVTGAGNTALESTVINWYIESSPKGADVNWRVVSSTPDVKNTNSKYLGSTGSRAKPCV